jgi:2,4-dienoyl-CoA reductase-like NADH-dependent reductase (Old Yellow Enzyme family)/thioredoxin reductase
MRLRNRMGVTAMGVSLAEADGSAGERVLAYHRKQAEGGIGLVTIGVTGVAYPRGGVQVRQNAISDDRHLPGLARMADTVHAAGARIAAQLHHGGLNATIDLLEGRPLWCPSLPPVETGDFMDRFLPEELEEALVPSTDVEMKVVDEGDIAQLLEWFAAGARRAREANFDGLEIHAGHGYLLGSFLSPATNRREDRYGGSRENRARLMVEVVRAVCDAAGPDIAVWVKLDGVERGRKNGITIDDAVEHARMAEAAGAHAIVATAYHDTSQGILHSESHTPHEPGLNIDNAARIKAAVEIPVVCSGRIEPEMADLAISDGKFDLLYMGRKLLADPHLPRKLAERRPGDIIPCIYCYTCISRIYLAQSMTCAVNPETAFERELQIHPATTSKRVVVVGGGPAGMESARRLAARDHDVILVERSNRLGGALQFAAIVYEPNERLLAWLTRQIETSSVEVRLETEASVELLRSLAPEEVVVATGAIRSLPPIPGADRQNVLSGDDLRKMVLGEELGSLEGKVAWTGRLASKVGAMTGVTQSPALIRKATSAWLPLGKDIVIIGGDLVGLEVAEFLAHRGRRVTVVDDTPRFGAGLQLVRRLRLLTEMQRAGVHLHPAASDIVIQAEAVSWTDSSGVSQLVPANHVIVAKGTRGDTQLADLLSNAGFKVHVAGDANGVGYIENAMRTAAELAVVI